MKSWNLDLQLFALVTTNPSKPKRVVKPLNSMVVDLTVASGAINPGELVYKTSGGKLASLNTTGASNANAANCVGIANDVYPVQFTDGVTGSPVPPSDANPARVQFYEDGDHLMKTTSGDTYAAYDTVYLGADGRTVSKTNTGTKVGYVAPDQRASSGLAAQPVNLPISGGTGVMIYVHIIPALA